MNFKVTLKRNKQVNSDDLFFTVPRMLYKFKLIYELYRWGLNHAMFSENISIVKLKNRDPKTANARRYSYELDLFKNGLQTKLELFLGSAKRQLTMASIGIVSFSALLGVSGESAEASHKRIDASSVSKESIKAASSAITHVDIESYLFENFQINNETEKFKMAYYHNNISQHVNTDGSHVNNPHSDNSASHVNTWSNAQTHQNTWNNAGHQDTPITHQNAPGGAHTNVHANTLPGDYIY